MLNAAKQGHSADPVSAVTKKGKTLLGVKHPIKVLKNTANVPTSTQTSGSENRTKSPIHLASSMMWMHGSVAGGFVMLAGTATPSWNQTR